MTTRLVDHTGKKFGMLTALRRADNDPRGRTRWECLCACGRTHVLLTSNLVKKDGTRSCGCWRRRAGQGSLHDGYVILYKPGHPNAGKRNGLVAQHVVVMSELLGRPLLPTERVHHKNKIRDDNRPENLELWTTAHPPGARVADLVMWARDMLAVYGEEFAA